MIGNGDSLLTAEGAGFCEITVAVATVGSPKLSPTPPSRYRR